MTSEYEYDEALGGSYPDFVKRTEDDKAFLDRLQGLIADEDAGRGDFLRLEDQAPTNDPKITALIASLLEAHGRVCTALRDLELRADERLEKSRYDQEILIRAVMSSAHKKV